MIPFEKYPGLSPLFFDFLRGLPEFFPDPPSLDAAAQRGKELLASGARARVPASAVAADLGRRARTWRSVTTRNRSSVPA